MPGLLSDKYGTKFLFILGPVILLHTCWHF